MRAFMIMILWVPPVLSAIAGCASAEKQERERSVHLIRRFAWETLRIRRPDGAGASPKAVPGEEDWESRPLPDLRFDCRPLGELHAGADTSSVRECLSGLKVPVNVAYRLRGEPRPYLELQDPEDAPECVRQHLARIPVPREIFFQSTEEGQLRCYAARLDLEFDRVPLFGFRWPLTRAFVRTTLSASLVSADKPESAGNFLSGVALGPFFATTGMGWAIPARLVPDTICKPCLGERGMLTPRDPPPRLWPAGLE